jgi:hypothetical protein
MRVLTEIRATSLLLVELVLYRLIIETVNPCKQTGADGNIAC